MSTSTAMPEVKGVPPGLTAEPLSSPTGEVKGVPEGLVAEALTPGAVKQQSAAVPKTDPFSHAQAAPPDEATARTFATNNPHAKPGSYTTRLSAAEEGKFQQWAKQSKVPWQDTPTADYDMRGYWKAQQSGDPNAKQAANRHFPDTYKTPYHKTFSNESQYALPTAPGWKGNRLVAQDGRVVADESPKAEPIKGVPAGVAAHPLPQNGTMGAYHPSQWQNLKRAIGETPTGLTVESNLDQIGRMFKHANMELSNPGSTTDEEWAQRVHDQTAFFEKHLGKNAASGAAEGGAEFLEGLASPYQMLLLAGTFGESALVQGAAKLGVKGAVPAAKTIAKLAQLQFATQMVEGTATGAENAVKSAWYGDWEGAGKNAIEGLASGLMAKGLVSHEMASERIHRDLDASAQQAHGKTFDQLDPYTQGVVIHDTVQKSPEYQEMLTKADEQQTKGKEDTRKQRQKKLSAYYEGAMAKAWQPDAAKRTVEGIQRAGEEDQRRQSIQDVVKTIKAGAERRAKAVQDEQDTARQAGREDRSERRQAAAGQRYERQKIADETEAKRKDIYAQRQEAQQAPSDVAQRAVEAVQSEDGNVTYPANYWGEENSFGVTGDVTGHGVYRQTPRGVEWLDANGSFVEEPQDVYTSPDPQAADTIARLSSLSATADTLADAEGATAEQKADAEKLASIRRDMVSGDIDSREAQRQAGIAEKVTLSDEFTAARDGQLTGPFHESSSNEYRTKLEDSIRGAGESGWEEEDINAVLDESMALARQQTESNLNHVYRPGDYIVSKRGVRWTLDSKNMLHPDDGGPALPLLRDGIYGNRAISLAESGRIGYGTQTREERRISAAKRREVEAAVRESQEQVAQEMRLATQSEGLQAATAGEPRADTADKQDRERRRMSRPPRPAESPESRIVRMIFQAPSDATSVISSIARAKETTPEEVMRMSLATDPAMSGTPEQKIAGLEPGDRIVEPIRNKPWVVEKGKDGQTYLRSGNAQPLKLDRLNPSDAVKGIIKRGEIDKDQEPTDAQKVAFENPHYVRWQDDQVADVQDLAKKPAPEPVTQKQADVQVQATRRRADAAESVATKALIEAVNDPKPVPVEQAQEQIQAAQEKVKTAEEAYAQNVEAQSKTEPKDDFPQRAPISIGLRGESGTMVQNNREVPFHYELVPVDALITSHEWNGKKMVENPTYPSALQPRTISETEAGQNALRAERGKYDFRQYADKTINGSMGPAIVDGGGQVVGGNTRLAILRKHLSILEGTPDVEERQAVMAGMKARMRQLATESGIARYPEDGKMYVVVRMMDEPIATTREAAELGRLFNKKVGVEIGKAAKGVSYSKALDDDVLREIGRLVDAHDGMAAAIQAEPDFFNKIVTDRFDVGPEEEADWFREIGNDDLKQKVMSEDGRNQFVKAMLGTVVKDASILNKLQGKTPYIALERALAHIVKMRGLPHMDITPKIIEAMQAAADTDGTNPGLSQHSDEWHATYSPDQQDFLGMEAAIPPEPDRMTEVIWRALNAGNRTLNDRLKSYIGDESAGAISMFEAQQETPAQAFNRAFRKEFSGAEHLRKDGLKELTQPEFQAALENREVADSERNGGRGEEPEQGQQDTAAPTKYEYGNTQANIPDGSEAAKGLEEARRQIAPEDLMPSSRGGDDDGLETNPHITLRYGLKDADTDRIKSFLEKQAPFDAKLGATTAFPPTDGPAPIIAPIEAAELHRIERELDRHGNFINRTFPEYKPHATIGYVKPEAVEKYKGMKNTEGKTFRVTHVDISHRDGSVESVELKGKAAGITRPPKPKAAAEKMAETKAAKGYVTPDALKAFLETNPATKDHAPELFRTAKLMAEYVYDADPPVGTERRDALDWVLRERLATIESGELKDVRGQYSDPIETGFTDGILRLHKAADASSFIHEFGHVVFPLLSDEDLRTMNRIIGDKHKYPAEWDGQRSTLKGEAYRTVSEKFAHGLEQFLRDENPTGFTHEVKAVLTKVKDIMRRVYLAFKGDPLADFQVGEAQREVFAKMFGITDFDVADSWRDEMKKARAEENRLKRPSEEKHPLQKLAADMGAKRVGNAINGKVEDTIGDRVDPRKPTAVLMFDKEEDSAAAWARFNAKGSKIADAELIEGADGEWGIRFNIKNRIPPQILEQGLPERHPGLELEDLEKRLKETPTFKIMERKLLQLRIDNMKNRIRAESGVEEAAPKTDASLPKAVREEVKRGKSDGVRTASDGVPGRAQPEGARSISKPPKLGLPGHAIAGREGRGSPRESVARVASLAAVTPVELQPMARERGVPVGTLKGQPFDAKAWADKLKAAGLPENAPPPTYALDPRVAQILKYPGQPQIVQMAMSALEQGDGFVVASATGTGKTYTAMATAREFRNVYPDAKILHLTKNRGLLKDAAKVAANSFGMEVDRDVPTSKDIEPGIYGATHIGNLNNKIYRQIPWDLVLTDESGELRNFFRDENRVGKAGVETTNNAKKVVWFSATPFHSPNEYGYLTKLNLWKPGGFDKWIQGNFAHEKVGDKIVARLDPSKQEKLRQQLIERGQMVSQTISYEGFNAHFGVVPVTDATKRSLDRIREGFARARDQFVRMGKKGMAEKVAAFEATYTKAYLERERIPQAIELAKKARAQGWHVMVFSETSAEDLFRRPRTIDSETGEPVEPSTYQQLDDAMGGQLSKIIPPFEDVYDSLKEEFGPEIVDYSGRGNTMASRDAAKSDFLTGKAPMLYTTFAAGGIGVSLHDADYPDLNVTGGDKPRVAVYLGPPYSGILLEQAMGRPWRFGTKSDVHAVFLATDSEPDIRLMQTKVGPRMKALRAAVHGEKDSLASVMATYTDEQKVRERQDMLAYSQGDEVKVSAANYNVRSKGRDVGINDWSAINFPAASDAMHKGMKYGEHVGDETWSNLFQSKPPGITQPGSPEDAHAKGEINRIGNAAVSGKIPEVKDLNPADRETATALAAVNATVEVDVNVDRDKDNLALDSMRASFKDSARIPYHGIMLTQEQGMVNIARMDGKPEVGYDLRRMNRSYRADWDTNVAQSWNLLNDSSVRNGFGEEPKNEVMRQVYDVVEGKKVSADPKVTAFAADIADMMAIAHDDLAKNGIKVKTKGGEQIPYSDFPRDPHYMPHRIDWDYEMVDPKTNEKVTVREFLKKDEDQQKRIIASIPEFRPYSHSQIMSYLRKNDPRVPAQGNIHYAREVNFPFIKKDYATLLGYFNQVGQAISAAKNFGADEQHLLKKIKAITNPRGQATLQEMFRTALLPQDWTGWTGKMYNAAVTWEAFSKMTFSTLKVPFHLVLGPAALHGRVMPHLKAFGRLALHPKETMENAAYVGTLVRQMNASDMMFGEHSNVAVRGLLKREGFEAAYRMVRTISGEAGRVYMEQYAMRDLKKGGTRAEETRRLLKDVFLVGDHGIDEAVREGRFSQEDLAKGQTAFTNQAAFSGSGDPIQMPGMARLEVTPLTSDAKRLMYRTIRLTYALQSFSVKAMSLMREHLWDEVMVHGNKKPLMYALIAFPVVGAVMQGVGTGGKHVVQKGVEKTFGKQHHEDSWDKYLAQLEDTFEHPEALKFLKWYIDSWALSAGAELMKTVADPLLNIAMGKPAKQDDYWSEDIWEHAVGPFFGDIGQIVGEVKNAQKIHSGKKHPEQKMAKYEKLGVRTAAEVFPALRTLPWVRDEIDKKPKKEVR